jgi:hypothetical protein
LSHTQTNQEASREVGPSPARRRLLLGAAAVLPSVYTLTSGAQTASISGFHCVAATPPANLPRFTNSSDAWVRKQVYTGKLANNTADCVTWNQASCVNPLSPDKAADGSIWIGNGTRVVAGPGNNIAHLSSAPKPYGLVYVDAKGVIQPTLDPNGNPSLQPATTSCATSMGLSATKSLLG